MEAIILAGGLGTRLQPVVHDLPKSMAVINGRPFLEYLMDFLKASGITHVVLSVGYRREMIISHFGTLYRGIRIDYAEEQEPLGTGGGIRLALWKVEGERVFAMNGDSLFRIDLKRMLEFHRKKRAEVTLALRRLEDTGRYGRVTLNRLQRITGFEEKREHAEAGYVNGGIYIIEKLFLMEPHYRGRFSIEKECFERLHGSARMFGFPSDDYFLDIGIPETLRRAQDEFAEFDD